MKNPLELLGLSANKKRGYYEIVNRQKSITILTKKYSLGKNIFLGKDIKICNHDGNPLEEITLGDNVTIHSNTTVMVPKLTISDYTKINNHFYAYGISPLVLGFNCWVGSSVILDTLGGLIIGNNVCIGSHSQIYSHSKFGDTLYGCRIHSYKSVKLEDDAWIAPNSTIIMASMATKSMLLAGGVLSKNTVKNHVYAGVPAKDITGKVGTQFSDHLNYPHILKQLQLYLTEFYTTNPSFKNHNLIRLTLDLPQIRENKISYFVVNERKYIKRLSKVEIAFMKFLLPDKAKFLPYN